ncbi:MAG: alpha/beta fold hydrolase [Thermoleophilia bacterium]
MAGSIAQTTAGPVEYAVVGSGHPVLVLHGSPGGIDQAAIMARFLPDDLQAVLVSRPGYLGTELGERRGLDDQAGLMVALLDHLGIDRAGVLAWSGGGPTAYRLAALHPDRVTALVVLAGLSGAYTLPATDVADRLLLGTRTGAWLTRVLVAHAPEKVVEGTIQSEGSLTADEARARVEEIFADEDKRRFVLDLAPTANHSGPRKEGYEHDLELFAAITSLELERIHAPVLLVQGGADTDVTPDHTEHAAATLPHAEVMVLETGTHLAFYTHPDAARAQARAAEVLRTG